MRKLCLYFSPRSNKEPVTYSQAAPCDVLGVERVPVLHYQPCLVCCTVLLFAIWQGPPAARGRSAFPRPPRRRLGGTRAAAAAELRRPRAGRRAAPGKLGAEARAPLPPRGRRSAPRPAWTASRCCRSGRPPTAPPRRARATTTGRATTAPSPPRSPASSRPRRTPTRAPRLPQDMLFLHRRRSRATRAHTPSFSSLLPPLL